MSEDARGPQFSIEYKGQLISGPDEASVREMVEAMKRGAEQRARWPRDPRQAMSALGGLFPSLRGVPGVSPWDADALIEWLNGPAPGSGAASAGRFLLSVWNRTDWTECGLLPPGRFDVFEAMACWDEEHVAAFQAWIDAPFWP